MSGQYHISPTKRACNMAWLTATTPLPACYQLNLVVVRQNGVKMSKGPKHLERCGLRMGAGMTSKNPFPTWSTMTNLIAVESDGTRLNRTSL